MTKVITMIFRIQVYFFDDFLCTGKMKERRGIIFTLLYANATNMTKVIMMICK
eukprot:Awhi_evm1s4675